MSEEFLSQEEIDALLGGGEEEKKEEERKEPVAPFDFSQVEHIKKGGLPGFELIFERWIKAFREDVRKILPHVNMVTKENIYISRFQNFMLKIPLPSSYTIFSMRPLKENALLVVDSRLVFTVISILFGGPAKPFKVEGREFTKLEMRVVEDFINTALKSFEQVWDSFYPVMIEVKSIELNPSLARIVSPNEKVIIVECKMDIDGYEAPFFFCFPQSMFLPIKDIVYSQVAFAEDPVWRKNIEEKIYRLNVKLRLEFVKKKTRIKDILSWKKGTEIPLFVSREEELNLYVEDRLKFMAKLGKVKDRYAAMITKPVVEEE
ncbi:flagellar motor switch protein FliM [Persephonella atlantica]|uniref:Flagellar motor switch protein FliM n=1 Tax=Persephonella atlantica TaxID=2699429 RepID=A0ABS1GHV6_9AQUI|nr:flagellar motor switch protein FliM [Persephonella atlantica]MBK3332488.1 flagellar motor switch protein FliM [Persephonella atlantica]